MVLGFTGCLGSRFLSGEKQPIVEAGVGNSDAQFAGSAAGGGPARPPGYRNAWEDCGGARKLLGSLIKLMIVSSQFVFA